MTPGMHIRMGIAIGQALLMNALMSTALVLIAPQTGLAAQSSLPVASPVASLAQDMRQGWRTFIFVSTHMPRQSLVELARDAASSGAVFVLRGFDVQTTAEVARAPESVGQPILPIDLARTQRLAADIAAACCAGRQPPHWIVDPQSFERYRVSAVPTFVLAWPGAAGQAADERLYTSVTGDMALANALKFIAQQSKLPALRVRAKELYGQAFGGRP